MKPGVTTREIDEYAASRIKAHGAKSAFLGYEVSGRKYPCHICISMNDEVVHGLASKRKVKEGDIVSLDCGVRVDGFIGDTARTVIIGECSEETQKLIDVTQQSLYDGISHALPGNRVKDISCAVQNRVEANGFSIVREFVGHGVGRRGVLPDCAEQERHVRPRDRCFLPHRRVSRTEEGVRRC